MSKLKEGNYVLLLDDVRSSTVIWNMIPITFHEKFRTKYEFILVKNYDEFVKCISKLGMPKFISFDHDLAIEHYPTRDDNSVNYDKYTEKTGYDCAKYAIAYCKKFNINFPSYYVHSMNPVGKDNIEQIITKYNK